MGKSNLLRASLLPRKYDIADISLDTPTVLGRWKFIETVTVLLIYTYEHCQIGLVWMFQGNCYSRSVLFSSLS